MDLIKCDYEGVPRLIQTMFFDYQKQVFEVRFFNGKERTFSADVAVPKVSKMQGHISPEQEQTAYSKIEELAHEHWQKWFPRVDRKHLRVIK